MANNNNGIDLNTLTPQEHLFELYDQMLGEVDIVTMLHKATVVVRKVLKADRATTYLILKDTHELKSAAIVGNVSRAIHIPINKNSLAGYCAHTGRSLVITDAYGDLSFIDPELRFDKSWDEINQYRTHDVLCTPAIFKKEVMGVVQAINRQGEPFREADLRQLQSVSRFVAYALYHARLYDELATMKCLEKEKAEFMRIMVHELKSPVAASISLASALQYANTDNPKLSSALSRIENRLGQLLELVKDIIQLSQIKSGGPLDKIAVFDLVELTKTCCDDFLVEAKSKCLNLNFFLPDNSIPVRIDRQGYKLILSNIVSNALKYTHEGSVKVSLQRNESWAILEIEDTGIGIPENDIPKLFKEFYRASNARGSEIQGTGVGLAGVKELVERFGGEIEFTSKENKGSKFTVHLPVHRK